MKKKVKSWLAFTEPSLSTFNKIRYEQGGLSNRDCFDSWRYLIGTTSNIARKRFLHMTQVLFTSYFHYVTRFALPLPPTARRHSFVHGKQPAINNGALVFITSQVVYSSQKPSAVWTRRKQNRDD